jgi:hypothetical protein
MADKSLNIEDMNNAMRLITELMSKYTNVEEKIVNNKQNISADNKNCADIRENYLSLKNKNNYSLSHLQELAISSIMNDMKDLQDSPDSWHEWDSKFLMMADHMKLAPFFKGQLKFPIGPLDLRNQVPGMNDEADDEDVIIIIIWIMSQLYLMILNTNQRLLIKEFKMLNIITLLGITSTSYYLYYKRVSIIMRV